jgi:CubicO group peptidase (beta-lactamase class C family)
MRLFVVASVASMILGCGSQAPLVTTVSTSTESAHELTTFLERDPRHNPEKGVQAVTYGVAVLYQGQLIYRYLAPGYSPDSKFLTWSVSKGFLHALLGIALKDGRIRIADSICKYLPSLTQLCSVKIEHLLTFSSGIDWKESYEDTDLSKSSVTQLLYGDGHTDMAGFVGSHMLSSKPGSAWSYSSGDAILLSAVLRAAYKGDYDDLPQKRLFGPLAMNHTTWERDASGLYVASAYVYTSVEDLARFGRLYLQEGMWKEKEIIPADWVRLGRELPDVFLKKRLWQKTWDIPGRLWWLNSPVPSLNWGQPWINAPKDTFSQRGHWGQLLVMIPSENLVIVRVGLNRGKDARFDTDTFLKLARALRGNR